MLHIVFSFQNKYKKKKKKPYKGVMQRKEKKVICYIMVGQYHMTFPPQRSTSRIPDIYVSVNEKCMSLQCFCTRTPLRRMKLEAIQIAEIYS